MDNANPGDAITKKENAKTYGCDDIARAIQALMTMANLSGNQSLLPRSPGKRPCFFRQTDFRKSNFNALLN